MCAGKIHLLFPPYLCAQESSVLVALSHHPTHDGEGVLDEAAVNIGEEAIASHLHIQ